MFKIGAFSRLSGVSAKRLRHYDEMGLFRPVWIDPTNGYRYYSPAQLPELHRIVALRDLGVPLAEVSDLVSEQADLAEALRRRRAELVAAREELERRLAALDIRVDRGGGSEHSDVVLRPIEPELVAGLRLQMVAGGDLEPMFNEVEGYVRDLGARAPRPPLMLIHGESVDGRRDLEPAVPLTRLVPSTDRISCRRLSGGVAAALIHQGGYEGLIDARRALDAWLVASRLDRIPPLRIVYLQFGADASLRVPANFLTGESARFVTELQQPVARTTGLSRAG